MAIYYLNVAIYYFTMAVYYLNVAIYYFTMAIYYLNVAIYYFTMAVYYLNVVIYYFTMAIYYLNVAIYYFTMAIYSFTVTINSMWYINAKLRLIVCQPQFSLAVYKLRTVKFNLDICLYWGLVAPNTDLIYNLA